MVIEGGGIGQRQGFAVGEEVEAVVGEVIGPGHRTIAGIGAIGRQRERRLDGGDSSLLLCRQPGEVRIQGCVAVLVSE